MAVPGRVPAISLGSVGTDSVFVSFQDGASSLPITRRQIVYGTDPNVHMLAYEAGGNSATIGGLSSGTTWYFWARVANRDGWGPYGGPVSATTLNPSQPPGRVPAISISDVTTNSFFVSFADAASSQPITVRQIGIGTTNAGIENVVNVGGNTYTFGNLTGGQTYYIWARVGSNAGWGDWGGPVSATTLNPQQPPGRVSQIAITDIRDTSMFVSMADPASSLPITVRQMGISTNNAGIQNVVNLNPGDTAMTFGNLQPGTAYYFWARAGSNAGWGEWGGPVSRSTVTPSPPNPPPALTISSVTSNSFFVSFSDGNNNGSPINRRQVGISKSNAGIQQSFEVTNVPGTITIQPLDPNTTYYVWARAANAYGWGDYTGPVATKTLAEIAPGPPPAVSAGNITAETMDVVFQAGASPGEPYTSHQIGYGTHPTTHMYSITVAADIRNGTIKGLLPLTKYYIWARSANRFGYGPWAGPIERTTLKALKPPGPPAAVLLSNTTTTSIEATFSPPEYEGTSPILEMQLGYGTSSSGPQQFVSSGGWTKLTNLQPGATYYFWARARNEVGWGEYSPVSTATLRAGAYVTLGSAAVPAIPYVNVNGVWHIAQPWIKTQGFWRGL